jgi:glycosyltransferase involved in cell wall biosynthesis
MPGSPETHRRIDEVHTGLLRRAAVVACDTPYEWLMLRAAAGPGVDCALIPLGFTPSEFTPGRPERRPYLLFVGDLKEERKRFPLVVNVFTEVLRRHPNLQLVVVGNKSEEMGSEIPDSVRRQCVLMGYVPEAELRSLYRDAAGLMQLSDYEAFGLPILEALASGTPVFLTRRPTVVGAFARYRGIVLIDDSTPARMAEPVSAVLDRGRAFIEEVLADRPRLEAELSWDAVVAKRDLAVRAAVAARAQARAAA